MADLKLGNMTLMGNVKVPPSKSMAHRAIICASLSQGISKIENIDFSDDIWYNVSIFLRSWIFFYGQYRNKYS